MSSLGNEDIFFTLLFLHLSLLFILNISNHS